jgi:agmatinase
MKFGDFPAELTGFDGSDIVLLPIPYDKTSTYGKGADKGPAALLDASYNLEFYDIETDSEPYLRGIHTAEPVICDDGPELLCDMVYTRTKELLDAGKFVASIGGEHSVSVGAAKAHCERYPNTTIIQLDAHSDLRESYHGSAYNHACVMARMKEFAPIVQAGIRSMDISEKDNMDYLRVFFAKDIAGSNLWMEQACSLLTENVYITFDLDAFDSSLMPSTGTPEPGGMFWWQALNFLREVSRRANIVGFDIVELCPEEGNPAPDFLAAKLLYKLLSYKFA